MRHLDLGGIDPEEIGRLMRLLASTDVEECEIEQGEYGISLRRSALTTPGTGGTAGDPGNTQTEESPYVPSPAVGVFHRSEARSDTPSIEAGTEVRAGDVLGVIEVMGVPHPVRAPRDGTVGDFVVDDGDVVEYGQPIVAFSD